MSKRANKRSRTRVVSRGIGKNLRKLQQEADAELNAELKKQRSIIEPAVVTILWREYGWRADRIGRRFTTMAHVWTECAKAGPYKSMLNILEDETGIEMILDGKRSYHEFQYLDGAKWDGKTLDEWQYIAMLQNEKPWIATLLIAAFLIALHRDERWGFDRLLKFSTYIDEMRRKYGEDAKKYEDEMTRVTGMRMSDIKWEGGSHETDRSVS